MEKLDAALATTLEQSIAAIKAMSGPIWQMMIDGIRIDGITTIIDVLMCIVVLVICYKPIITITGKLSRDEKIGEPQGYFLALTIIASVVAAVMLVVGVFEMSSAVSKMLYPEAYIGQRIVQKIIPNK